MVVLTQCIKLDVSTSDATATDVVDRSNMNPLKWFSFTIEGGDAYIGINKDADSTEGLYIKDGETYTTPMKVRLVKLSVMRKDSADVTVRGSAWY